MRQKNREYSMLQKDRDMVNCKMSYSIVIMQNLTLIWSVDNNIKISELECADTQTYRTDITLSVYYLFLLYANLLVGKKPLPE